jgi:probable sporulation protein (polysaccharide deacetylase family)
LNRKTTTRIGVMLFSLIVVLLAGTYGPLEPFVHAVKTQKTITSYSSNIPAEDSLLDWIKAEADKQMRPPIDAVVDRVWKAIPGYNGRIVDIQATYHKAKIMGSIREADKVFPWVYQEVQPKVALKDLPLQPLYRGNSAKPMVAFMINVAWGDEYLLPILDILKENDVKATFFLDGTWLSKHKEMAKSILTQGHELSNHAYSHPNMSQLSSTRQREEIGKTEALLKELGVENIWFAPPSGDYNARTVEIASEYGLRTVLWTLDTLDWTKPEPSGVVAKISKQVEAGHLILMHPTAASQHALTGMIKGIRAKGYLLGTVSQTLSPDRAGDRL